MARISKTGISNGGTIDASHITRIIEALDGTGSADVYATGSFTGSFIGNGSGLTNVTASSAASASFASTASYLTGTAQSASFASTASYLTGTVQSASFASTASYLTGTIESASFATTASYIKTAQTASHIAWSGVRETTTDTFLGTASYADSINKLSPYTSIVSATYTTTGSQIANMQSFVAATDTGTFGIFAPTAYVIETTIASAFIDDPQNIGTTGAFGCTLSATFMEQNGVISQLGPVTKTSGSDFVSHVPGCNFGISTVAGGPGGMWTTYTLGLRITGSSGLTGSWVSTTRITDVTGQAQF